MADKIILLIEQGIKINIRRSALMKIAQYQAARQARPRQIIKARTSPSFCKLGSYLYHHAFFVQFSKIAQTIDFALQIANGRQIKCSSAASQRRSCTAVFYRASLARRALHKRAVV